MLQTQSTKRSRSDGASDDDADDYAVNNHKKNSTKKIKFNTHKTMDRRQNTTKKRMDGWLVGGDEERKAKCRDCCYNVNLCEFLQCLVCANTKHTSTTK